jgi:hypothetical protein
MDALYRHLAIIIQLYLLLDLRQECTEQTQLGVPSPVIMQEYCYIRLYINLVSQTNPVPHRLQMD